MIEQPAAMFPPRRRLEQAGEAGAGHASSPVLSIEQEVDSLLENAGGRTALIPEPAQRPRLLDLFCGAGGAAMGYHRAGFDVVGVDINPQPHYPFEFHQADALTFPLDGFDAIHASPPCQAFTRAGHLRTAQGRSNNHLDLVAPTRERLAVAGLPYVIENVPGAPVEGIFLCGSAFDLAVRRHRIFESNVMLFSAGCRHREQGRPVGVYYRPGEVIPNGGRTAGNIEAGREAMGIDWMPWDSLKEAIPPAYTEWIGAQLIRAVAHG